MKKLAIILTILISITSCMEELSPISEATTPSKWKVEWIEYMNEILCAYKLYPIEENNLNSQKTWHLDTIGKFEVGDTLTFQFYKNPQK